MDQYQTSEGRREDLEAIETNPYLGFIGPRCMPVVNVMEKTGTVYYKTLTADSAAQTDRTTGTAPSRTLLTDSSTTFTCTEAVKRYGVSRDEVKQMGGIENADKLGGTASKRSVQRAVEGAIAAQVLAGSGVTVYDIEASFLKRFDVAIDAIHRYAGPKALVCSYSIARRLLRYTEILNRFSLSSAVVQETLARAIIGGNRDALKAVLAGILGIDEVLIGDDDLWYDASGTYQDRATVMALPSPDEFSHKMDPVFGKCMMYLPDGKQPYVLESFYDPDVKVNNYDAECWYNLLLLNAGAAYILSGIDDSNTIQTSTTTTTT